MLPKLSIYLNLKNIFENKDQQREDMFQLIVPMMIIPETSEFIFQQSRSHLGIFCRKILKSFLWGSKSIKMDQNLWHSHAIVITIVVKRSLNAILKMSLIKNRG